ncbi:MAG: thioesterase family protein [Deltaproteobacteria bacterium]|nr:thioesterase family protein [Deltaproteobacteria bacterium]
MIALPTDDRPRLRWQQRVTYVDTDAAQVVHHASYLRYFEIARIEFLRAHGWDYAAWLAREQLGLPVAENWVKYRSPARFDDLLTVETWVAKATRASIRWEYLITRGAQRLTEGFTVTPCTTLDGAIRRVPRELLAVVLGATFDPSSV